MAHRVTMSDIADRAGVSRVAVSYALNGRPGVSAEMRARILRIAEEIGFSANTTAMALKGALAQTIGLALRTPAPGQGVSGYHRSFISGLQAELSVRRFGLTLQFAADHDEELALYRRWHGEQRVDGVVVTDLTAEDPRPPEVAELGLPAVLVGDLESADPGPARIGMDESTPAFAVARHLADRGHRSVVHVAGPNGLRESRRRVAAFAAACDRHSLAHNVLHTDQTGAAAAQATRRVLSSTQRPDAIVYDTDVMAVAGLGVAMEMRVPVPTGIALVSWEDSALCPLVRPALTALRRDLTGYGASAARLLLAAIDDGTAGALRFPEATLQARAST